MRRYERRGTLHESSLAEVFMHQAAVFGTMLVMHDEQKRKGFIVNHMCNLKRIVAVAEQFPVIHCHPGCEPARHLPSSITVRSDLALSGSSCNQFRSNWFHTLKPRRPRG